MHRPEDFICQFLTINKFKKKTLYELLATYIDTCINLRMLFIHLLFPFISIIFSYKLLFICFKKSYDLTIIISTKNMVWVSARISPTSSLQVECDTKFILNVVQLVWIQNFLSPRLVAKAKIKNSLCSTILREVEEQEISPCILQGQLLRSVAQITSNRIWTRVIDSI